MWTAIDFETVEIQPDASVVASTEAYRKNFRVDSMAVSTGKDGIYTSSFYKGEEECREALRGLQNTPLVSFNAQFEMLVSMCRFPELQLDWRYDAMRLCQVYDNSGKDNDYISIPLDPDLAEDDPEQEHKLVSLTGFGLAKCVQRILNLPDPKTEAYKWLVDNEKCKKGQEGAHLHLLPPEILERYNIGDTENTLRLLEFCLMEFERIDYDWTIDHNLYISSCKRLASSKKRGIRVNTAQALEVSQESRKGMSEITFKFLTHMAEPIKLVEADLLAKRLAKFKKQKGIDNYLAKGPANKDWSKNLFNPGSGDQLERLFVDKLGIKPFFYTEKGSPSFKAAHLYTYGEGGSMLTERKKLQIVATQAEALYGKAAYDGRYHVDLKSCATRTSRFSGGGGLNIQAMARRHKKLMSCMIPDEGNIFVSQDASAGEPTILTQYTKDKNYKYFCFDGIGKRPFYANGVLYIDDIYLAYASVDPLFRGPLREIFDNEVFPAGSFADQWMVDKEVVKEHPKVKKIRKNAKWECLAFGYGLGPKGFYNKAIEAGLQVTPKMCAEGYHAYWDLFKGIKQYCKQLENHVKETGWLQNPWGYRFVPTELRKSFNGMVQSSVSGLFNWYSDLLEIEAPYATYVTTIHDENLYELPIDRLDDFRKAQQTVIDYINDTLQWDVKLRFGFVAGADLFQAK